MLSLTMLGKACGESPLRLESAMRLVELVRRMSPSDQNGLSLLAVLQALPERDENYTPQMRGGEARWHSEAVERFGYDLTDLLRHNAEDNRAYYGRCKRAAIIDAWLGGVPMAEIERTYTLNPFAPVRHGDVVGMADGTRFLLESARRIAEIVVPDPEKWSGTEVVLRRLEEGLPEAGLVFSGRPLFLRRGEICGLLDAGVTSGEALATLSKEDLSAAIGRRGDAIYLRLHPDALPAPETEPAE
ncbi:hypothetical protein G6N74_28305 [Mesorhizobium sp. CGMCC 1.15528]|uniref:Uncharacterized protein n=1 Tax=Mesorhizobium zhangyense TaxID=1776730 RepID=A0A7C9VBV0_9HYPH|nr:hypothetical protein [Mesorhizobium zhangyense]NGN44963.1 hypothetical protein [Mesorhizobium zhangyense]